MAFFEVISQQSATGSGAQLVQLRGEGAGGGFQAVLSQALGTRIGQAGAGRAEGAGQGTAGAPLALVAGSQQGADQAGRIAVISQAQSGPRSEGAEQARAALHQILGLENAGAARQPTGQASPHPQQSAASQLQFFPIAPAGVENPPPAGGEGGQSGEGQAQTGATSAGLQQARAALDQLLGIEKPAAGRQSTGQTGPQTGQSAPSQLQLVPIAPAAGPAGSAEAAAQVSVTSALPAGVENALSAGGEGGQSGEGESLLKALRAEGEGALLPIGILLNPGGPGGEARAAGTAGTESGAGQSVPTASSGSGQPAGPALRLVAGLLSGAAGETPGAQPGPAQAGEALAGESLRPGQAGTETAGQTGAGAAAAARGDGQTRPLQFLAGAGASGSQGESAQIGEAAGEEAARAATRTSPGGRTGPSRQIPTLFAQQPQTQTAAAASSSPTPNGDLDPATRNFAANMAAGREGGRANAGAGLALEATGSGSGHGGSGGQNQPQSQLPFQIQNLQALTAKAPKASANASSSSASFEALLGAAGGQSGPSAGPGAGGAGTATPGAAGSTAGSAGTPQTSSGANTPATQVGLSMGKAAANGQNRFTLRLEPPEMGRVEVKMEVSSDGNLRAKIRSDRRDTLDLLQRDVRSLQRALADAGLKADSGSLNFSLSQQGRDGSTAFGGDDTGRDGGSAGGGKSGDGDADEPDAREDDIRFYARERDRLDITV